MSSLDLRRSQRLLNRPTIFNSGLKNFPMYAYLVGPFLQWLGFPGSSIKTSLFWSLSERFFCAPASFIDSVVNSDKIKSEFFAKLPKWLFFAFELYKKSGSRVSVLVNNRRPFAVSRPAILCAFFAFPARIIAAYIYPVYRMIPCRWQPHICQISSKGFSPTLTYFDAFCAIIWVRNCFFVIATIKHVAASLVKRVFGYGRAELTSYQSSSFPASAGFSRSFFKKPILRESSKIPAKTYTKPFASIGFGNNSKTTKALANKINYTRHVHRLSIHRRRVVESAQSLLAQFLGALSIIAHSHSKLINNNRIVA